MAANDLIGRLARQGSFDVVGDLARILPVSIVSSLVGLPKYGRKKMPGWAAFDALGVDNDRAKAAFSGLGGLMLSGHLGFGQGRHVRAGMHLAKLEIRSLLKSVLDKVASIEVGTPVYQHNILLRRAPNILPIPGTSFVAHLRENLAADGLRLPDNTMAALDGVAGAGTA